MYIIKKKTQGWRYFDTAWNYETSLTFSTCLQLLHIIVSIRTNGAPRIIVFGLAILVLYWCLELFCPQPTAQMPVISNTFILIPVGSNGYSFSEYMYIQTMYLHYVFFICQSKAIVCAVCIFISKIYTCTLQCHPTAFDLCKPFMHPKPAVYLYICANTLFKILTATINMHNLAWKVHGLYL